MISKACAKQRTGRAGRTREGSCYRLYTAEQYQSMKEYTTPEIKCIALSEISLKARILAPDQSIIEFLQTMVDSPSNDHIRQSIVLLKDINALNSNEELTNLGYRLVHLPVDCQLGKMVLYAIFFKCLDPILTIVSALSMKDPFLMPKNNESREKLYKARMGFGNDALSDHQMLLDIYQGWRYSDSRQRFCKENSISHLNMEMIENVRTLLERHLASENYVSDKAHVNENALKWEVVKACIIAGGFRKNIFVFFLIENNALISLIIFPYIFLLYENSKHCPNFRPKDHFKALHCKTTYIISFLRNRNAEHYLLIGLYTVRPAARNFCKKSGIANIDGSEHFSNTFLQSAHDYTYKDTMQWMAEL